MRHANPNPNPTPNPHHNDRSRQSYYEDEMREDDYHMAAYPVERLPYPGVAAAQLRQQHAMFENQSRRMGTQEHVQTGLHMNGLPQVQHMQYYSTLPRNRVGKVIAPNDGNGKSPHYGQTQTFQFGREQVNQRLQEERDAVRYAELYDEVFAQHSRTPSGMMTLTERTRGTQVQTSTSASRSTSEYETSDSSSSETDSYGDNWEDNIITALNDMAGNLKKIGGIHCNQAGPDSTEVQLKINVPLPMHNLDEVAKDAMASLSPKKCNMQYDYSHLDDQVFEMEEQFLGAMDKIQGNMMPVYKSLFESQSDSSSSDDDDDDDDDNDEMDRSESTYEDPRFLPKPIPGLRQEEQKHRIPLNTPFEKNVDGVPSQIIISEQPSAVSASDSWMLLSPRDKPDEYPTEPAANDIINKINDNLDVAINGSRIIADQNETLQKNDRWIPATKQQLVMEDPEDIEKEHRVAKPIKAKLNTIDAKPHIEIPQVIDCTRNSSKNGQEDIPKCYSDLTSDYREYGQIVRAPSDKDKPVSTIPMIETQFSGTEIVGLDKASFQRNSIKKGSTFNSELDDVEKEDIDVSKVDSTAVSSTKLEGDERNKSISNHQVMVDEGDEIMGKIQQSSEKSLSSDNEAPDDEINNRREEESEEERKQMEAWEQKRKKLEEERKRIEEEARVAEAAETERKVEDKEQIEVEAKAQTLVEAEMISEEEAKRKEAEAETEIQTVVEAERIAEEETKRKEAEAEAEAEMRAKEEKTRREAETKQEREAFEAKMIEEDRKQREAEMKAEEEAKKLEEERKLMEAEAKAARKALNAKKLEEERRRAEAEAKAKAKVDALEAKMKMEEEEQRMEAEARAKEEALAKTKLEEERKRIEAEEGNHPNEKEDKLPLGDRASLYKIQGFDDYCRRLSNTGDNAGRNSTSRRREPRLSELDMDDGDTSSVENQSASNVESFNEEEYSGCDNLGSGSSSESHPRSSGEEELSLGSRSFSEQSRSRTSFGSNSTGEESDAFSAATSFVEEFEDFSEADCIRESGTNNTGTRSVNFTLSSGATVNTTDKTVQSSARRRAYLNEGSTTSQLLSSTSYTSDMPITLAATMSTLQTSDQGTVQSGQHSLGRFLASDASVMSTTSYSHQSVMSAKPISARVIAQRNEKIKSNSDLELRSSILGSIVSLVVRLMFSTLVFVFMWIKHLVFLIGKKRPAKIDCQPTRFALQPGQSIRREEIQDRSLDSFIHRSNTRRHSRAPYLLHEEPCREHYTTTMVLKPPSAYLGDDSDEVGTCVESIVPDTHCPNASDGKISTWKITPDDTDLSSLSSPPSKSFRVLKTAYSALSFKKREREKSNWIEHETIDDEMSYYD